MTASARRCSSLVRTALVRALTSLAPSALSLVTAFPPAESPPAAESLSYTSGWGSSPASTLEYVVITVHGQRDKVTRSAAKLPGIDNLHRMPPLFSANHCTTWRIFYLHKAV